MEVLDIGGLEGPRFTAALELQTHFDLEFDPHLPPTTADELRLLATVDRTENGTHRRVAAFDGKRAIAIGHLELTHDQANPTFCSAEIDCLDDDAAGHVVLADLLDRAEADNRTTMLGWGELTPEESAFWTGVGMTERYVERLSELDLAAVDDELMQRWIDDHEQRAGDIALVPWVGACPDGYLDAFVATSNAMNDAPLEDIDRADVVVTTNSVRREEMALAAIGYEHRVLLAIDPDGGAAGMTAVHVNIHRPKASWQWDTVVLREHRQRGIGRWLKAAMWRWLRDDRPEVTTLQTGNAESNDAMLAINVAMGYQPVHEMAAWQADIAVLRRGLRAALDPESAL